MRDRQDTFELPLKVSSLCCPPACVTECPFDFGTNPDIALFALAALITNSLVSPQRQVVTTNCFQEPSVAPFAECKPLVHSASPHPMPPERLEKPDPS
eukprot:CAMPEP_0174380996 /NCGR_PEP_ID=MMETSP0811_2-20130205/123721_1 /TAXON_ID=73025 ORGANISM="Eutreptiella gymnastica-like, Strain CCMP1594" /NCGR_SAMPLE_ID=MMETSP0811_2 /ASSEMBLY_ACC=CAM_ASM_000667 /LENGTH=97 /DNA_ID=CAMNT_0015534003 /DNA_START=453 /DNA_END=746 /DNA_ORIENTATION=-